MGPGEAENGKEMSSSLLEPGGKALHYDYKYLKPLLTLMSNWFSALNQLDTARLQSCTTPLVFQAFPAVISWQHLQLICNYIYLPFKEKFDKEIPCKEEDMVTIYFPMIVVNKSGASKQLHST